MRTLVIVGAVLLIALIALYFKWRKFIYECELDDEMRRDLEREPWGA